MTSIIGGELSSTVRTAGADSSATVIVATAGGRLTLESGTAVSITDQVGKSVVYCTPYHGNQIALYNGSAWIVRTFTEKSITLSGLTSGTNYDVFGFDSASNLMLELSSAWTTDTARADSLTNLNGVLVKSSALTRRYLGTIRTTGTTTTEDSNANRFVYNSQNKVTRRLYRQDTTSHSYNGACRQWNNDAANQVALVLGEIDQILSIGMQAYVNVGFAGIASQPAVAALLDNSTSASFPMADVFFGNIANEFRLGSSVVFQPGLGYHFVAITERTEGAVNSTFGDAELSGFVHA